MTQTNLRREVGIFGATLLGLGSVLGTGIFVSISLATAIVGADVVLAVAIAAAVATCNALSSAQLAANHPVSGGTYEYGYRYLRPWLGFSAGWMFFGAKSASAATAALGFSGYLLHAIGTTANWLPYLAVITVVLLTLVVLSGIRVSNKVNIAIVSITLLSLASFVIAGALEVDPTNFTFELHPRNLLHATALMFVAYTGYGRIATLGEEMVDPRRTIPRAIVATLLISMAAYVAVAAVYVGTSGPSDETHIKAIGKQTAPLEIAAREFSLNVHWLVAVGAMTAMLGVLLNLLLGLSRVALAMGRRGDLPQSVATVNPAVLTVGAVIAVMAYFGSVQTTWSFSAFTVLIYYAVTNLAAIRLPRAERLYSSAWAWTGLLACLALAFSIERQAWASGIAMFFLGLAWHFTRAGSATRGTA